MSGATGAEVIRRGLRVMWRAVRDEPRLFTISVAGSILFSLLIIAGAYVLGWVVGQVVVPAVERGRIDTGLLAGAAAVLIGISLLRVVGIFARRLGAGFMQYHQQATYRRRVTRRYLDLPLSWHQRHATGTLLSNANSDVEAAWFPIAPLPFAVGTVVMLAAAIATLFATDWVLALVGLIVFPALFGMNVIYSRRMAPRQARAQQLRGTLSAIAHESFDGALVVKTMGRETYETDRFGDSAGELRDGLISIGRLRGLFDPMLESLPSVGTLIALLVGAWRLQQGAITVTEVVSVAFLFTLLAFPVRAIGWVLAELPRSVAGWERVSYVLGATGDMVYGSVDLPAADGAPAALRFDGVSFAYPAGEPPSSDDLRPDEERRGAAVLHDVSFEVPAGRTVALVGPTGSGKSTIATLAVRLTDPDRGTVTLDGVDMRRLTAAALARTAALVPQVPFVFDDSVRANVTLGRSTVDGTPISDDAVHAALRRAQIDEFVAGLPDGLDTHVGERGTTLSGGQRQRLTLARALAGQPRLLVLDDATSAVDPRVEAAILGALRSGDAAASILVVAYRRATIALADEVVYVEQGRVVARGTHRELLATTPGYAELVTAYERAEAERERERTAGVVR